MAYLTGVGARSNRAFYESSFAALMALGCAAVTHGQADWHQATAMTFGWGVFEPSISGDGRFVAFRSANNLVGENSDVNFEIFLFDRESGGFTQVTNTPSLFGNFEPMVTPDGSAIVFRSLYNFVGTNGDGSFELFEYTVATGAFKQLTFTPGFATVGSPKMSSDGSRIAYISNFDGTYDVMRVQRATSEVVSVTNFPTGCLVSNPTINGDGTVVAFRSNHNLNGLNPDLSAEIWRWQEGAGITLVTNSPQIDELPSIDGSGRYVAFISRANYAGENAAFSREIFVADTLRGGFVQVTPAIAYGKNLEPVMSADGTSIVFESDRDPVGLNPDKNRELFRYSRARDSIEQITQTIGGMSIAGLSEPATINYVSISLDGQHLGYRNEHELDPGAADPEPQVNLEVFIATFEAPPVLGDIDGDGMVGNADLAICLGAWGTNDPAADLTGDGTVDLQDVSILLGAWS
jgi:Tol biopolymer transport system component